MGSHCGEIIYLLTVQSLRSEKQKQTKTKKLGIV